MTSKYEFDAVRWLRNIAEVQSHRAGAGAAMLRENMLKCAEEIHRLRMAVDLHEQGAELMRDEAARLKEEVVALKVAVRLFIITTQPVLGEDGHLWVTQYAVDALAALVGEEK